MRNILLTLAYDGTEFCGWQSQRSGRTVQQTLEAALAALHGHRVAVNAAGRTDAGVHAEGQRVTVCSDNHSIPIERFPAAINGHLPPDVRILKGVRVSDTFHARFDATAREYCYRLTERATHFPRWRNYCHRVNHRVDLTLLNRICSQIVGEHDYAAFASVPREDPNTVRRVHSAAFYPSGGFVLFHIVANGFLRRMVRSLVGTMLELSTREHAAERFAEALASRDRSQAGTTVSPRGLTLRRVYYQPL